MNGDFERMFSKLEKAAGTLACRLSRQPLEYGESAAIVKEGAVWFAVEFEFLGGAWLIKNVSLENFGDERAFFEAFASMMACFEGEGAVIVRRDLDVYSTRGAPIGRAAFFQHLESLGYGMATPLQMDALHRFASSVFGMLPNWRKLSGSGRAFGVLEAYAALEAQSKAFKLANPAFELRQKNLGDPRHFRYYCEGIESEFSLLAEQSGLFLREESLGVEEEVRFEGDVFQSASRAFANLFERARKTNRLRNGLRFNAHRLNDFMAKTGCSKSARKEVCRQLLSKEGRRDIEDALARQAESSERSGFFAAETANKGIIGAFQIGKWRFVVDGLTDPENQRVRMFAPEEGAAFAALVQALAEAESRMRGDALKSRILSNFN